MPDSYGVCQADYKCNWSQTVSILQHQQTKMQWCLHTRKIQLISSWKCVVSCGEQIELFCDILELKFGSKACPIWADTYHKCHCSMNEMKEPGLEHMQDVHNPSINRICLEKWLQKKSHSRLMSCVSCQTQLPVYQVSEAYLRHPNIYSLVKLGIWVI